MTRAIFYLNEVQTQPLEPGKKNGGIIRKIFTMLPRSRKDFEARKISSAFAITLVIVAAFFVYKVTSTAIFYASNFKPADLLYLAAGKVEQDELHRTNVLIVGVGGGDHDAPDLTDTMIVASFLHDSQILSMLSIPRDLYITTPQTGGNRINKIYEILKPRIGSAQALETVAETAGRITNLPIHYYVKIDFDGFKDVVDTLGGVEIEVPVSINDPWFPDDRMQGYTVFRIDAGLQHMDGETALKYARSRQTTSDFDRSLRQQQLIRAIKEKALRSNLLGSPVKLKQLWDHFENAVETNITLREMITFGKIAKQFDSSRIVSKGLRDTEIVQEGGFLYTPERALYGGAFVLLPWGNNYNRIHAFTRLLFETPEAYLENARIEIQNGTNRNGLATRYAQQLVTHGFHVAKTGNAPNKERFSTSTISVTIPDTFPATLATLQEFLQISTATSPPAAYEEGIDIVIVLGEDAPL